MFESVEAFYRPANVRQAVDLLRRGKGAARIVAGCTDLAVDRDRSVRFLIDLGHAGLRYIRKRGAQWTIGATATMTDIEESAEIQSLAGGLLARAAWTCGSVQIRNMATVGGNMANGSPAADLAPPLLALDAVAVIADPKGRRRIPLAERLAAPRDLAVNNSVLVEIAFRDPPRGPRCGWSFQKFGRTEVDIALASVAAGLELDARGRVKWARIALGALAPAPVRSPAAETLMIGRAFAHRLLAEVSEAVLADVSPVSDIRASAEYRRDLAKVLTRRALEECAQRRGSL